MYQEQRIRKIVSLLEKEKVLSTTKIAQFLKVSRDTARRDILKCLNYDNIVRTHGGIMIVDENESLNFNQRSDVYNVKKGKMARICKKLLTKHSILYLDVSTTILLLSSMIDISCTVYTHSIDNAYSLSHKKQCSINLIGGQFNFDNRFFSSEYSKQIIENTKFDVAIIGAASLEKDGIYYNDIDDAAVIRSVVRSARKVVLISEMSKFNKKAHYRGSDWSNVDIFVTDEEVPESTKNGLKEGMEILF